MFSNLFICVIISNVDALYQKAVVAGAYSSHGFDGNIRIGAPISFQIGDNFFSYGVTISNAWNMFSEWVNDRGGIKVNGKNYSVSVHYVEDYSNSSLVAEICNFLTNTSNMDFMFGPYSSSLTTACIDFTDPRNVLLMSGGSSDTDMFRNSESVFGTLPGDLEYATTVFGALDGFGATSVAVIRDTDFNTCSNASIFRYANVYEDLEFVGLYDVDPSSPTYEEDVTNLLTDLQARGVESIFACSYDSLCTLIPSTAQSLDYNLEAIMFTSCLSDTNIATDVSGEDSYSAYLYGVAPWAPTSKLRCSFTNWTAQEFSDRYETIYNVEPSYHAASAFAAGLCLVGALEDTQSMDTEVLKKSLETNFYNTFYANVTFNSIHQAKFDMLLSQILPSVSSDGVTTWALEIVQPANVANREAVYPSPTWAQRTCVESTSQCADHGQCDTSGVCQCDPNYYGGENPASCDTYCDGLIESNVCKEDKVLYIGGMVAYQYAEGDEYRSTMKLAVDLINNKTDGWFDDSTAQIQFKMMLNNSACSGDIAVEMLQYQIDWCDDAVNRPLDGLIGAECSAGSKSTASYGGPQSLPQISFKSSASDLADKDEYPYFARTCASDSSQGPSLATLLMQIGVKPYVSMVSTTDDYGTSMSKSFSTSYQDSGNTILTSIVYSVDDPDIDYYEIVNELAVSGAPAIVLVLYPEEVSKVLDAASTHPVLGTDAVIWISVDSWSDLELDGDTVIPEGVIGLTSSQANNSMTVKYRRLWESLDPEVYKDTDGDRSTFAAYSLHIVDAVASLAMAYQKAFDDNTGLEDALLREYVYSTLTKDISFEGVSGYIEFDAQGDLENPQFRIVNYHSGEWLSMGTATSTESGITQPLAWPDGTIAYNSTAYAAQLIPYCPAGQEPVLGTTGTYVCSLCDVGYYNPEANSQGCKLCPEGADCNDVGIVIPCILPGYWRAEPKAEEDMGNFNKYRVYSCDFPDGCKGGCYLNASCASNRVQSSPTCGVCRDGYYPSGGDCIKCDDFQKNNSSWLLGFVYGTTCLFFVAALYGVLWASVSFSMSSFRVKASMAAVGASHGRGTKESRPVTMSGRLSMGIERLSALLQNRRNVKVGKKLIRGTAMTAKLVISFVQVVSGSFATIHIDWPQHTANMFSFLSINPIHALESTYMCSESHSGDHPYFVGIILHFLTPFAFLSLLLVVASTVRFIASRVYVTAPSSSSPSLHSPTPSPAVSRDSTSSLPVFDDLKLTVSPVEDRASSLSTADEIDAQKRLDWAVWNTSGKLYLWFCLITYPSISASMLGIYNCRDLGTSGIFLQADYSLSCESNLYAQSIVIGVFGTILYPIGIPVIFYHVIKNRKHPLLDNPAKLLYDNFAVEWMYYEVYDLVRKLLLTSVMPFVAPPDTPSQCLFLLLVDMMALVILAYSRPYANTNDDFLSGVLISVECGLFLLALVVVSDISSDDNYNELALYNTTFAILLVSLAFVVPYTLAMKFTFFKSKSDRMINKLSELANRVGISLPDLHRLDAKARMNEDFEELQRQSLGLSQPGLSMQRADMTESEGGDGMAITHNPFLVHNKGTAVRGDGLRAGMPGGDALGGGGDACNSSRMSFRLSTASTLCLDDTTKTTLYNDSDNCDL